MKHGWLIAAWLWVACACAEPAIEVPVVLPEALAQRWLQDDPALQNADSAFAAAQAEAGQTAASPYEWNASYTRQQRDYGTGPKSDEWNVGVERTVRLPNKYGIDATSAEAMRGAALAQRSLARRQAVEALLGTWFDWLLARADKTLLAGQVASTQQSVAAVRKRVESGDAALLEQRLAEAELAGVQRQASEADTAEAVALAVLAARYPVEGVTAPTLPEPAAIAQDANWWQTRIVSVSDRLVATQAELARAQSSAKRAKADRLPDPTLGVFTGREAYGDEQIVGVSVSIPLPGKRRSLEVQKQLAQADSARQNLALIERELNGATRSTYVGAVGNFERWKLARDAADTLRDNARLAQKAYTLGEQDLQALLLARRQALSAAQAEAQARGDALRAYYRLLLDAKLLWPQWLNAPDAAGQSEQP
ncbi:MAG: TolC family protein [Gammaproteobacteria bacterium]|nr:TolC family protein [Gammaproteobacteria bacterium]